ncbi:hypothetical protein PMAYCL1PPCAC_03908, partial [Pristionchus mayeri]
IFKIINLTHWLSFVFFGISLVLNGTLIYAITRHSSMHTGTYYKSMQTGLACTNILVAGTIMLIRPAIHIHGGIFFWGGPLQFFPFSFEFATFLIVVYMVFFILKSVAMGTVMVFRVWTMSRRMSSLPSHYVLFIPLVAFTLAIPPTIFFMALVFPSEDTQNICLVRDVDGVCTETIGHAVSRHLAPNSGFLLAPLQLKDWYNYPLAISLILILVLMIGTLVVVLAGAVWILKQAGESRDFRLHRQLARALLCQASFTKDKYFQFHTPPLQILVPAVFMQMPMAVGIIGFLLRGKMDYLLMSIPIINSLYTCIDPLVIIINVKSYWRGLAR